MQTFRSTQQLGKFQVTPNISAMLRRVPSSFVETRHSFTPGHSIHTMHSLVKASHRRGGDGRRNVAVKASEELFQFEEGNYHRSVVRKKF
jgi:hypothetical protein